MNDQFIKNAKSWGDEGDVWLQAIPELVKKYEKQWAFKALKPFTLNYNYVAPVELEGSASAVLKIGFPGDKEFRSELEVLRIFHGDLCVKILKSDSKDSLMLLERILPGTPLSQIEDDDEATRILLYVIKGLNRPLPPNKDFTTIEDWTKAIPDYLDKHASSGLLPVNLVTKAQELFEHLIATSEKPVLVHGDLHHDNVLLSDDKGWIAIDPKGIAAEPLYEVAAMIRNPYEKLDKVVDLEPLLRSRIAILSKGLNADPERIRQWCFAQTMLSAVWSAGGVKGHEHALRVAETLDKL